MNKRDVFFVRGNVVSLNLVLGLMDSAESSGEAYQWATTGLIHACHTQDAELCQYIEDSLHRQHLRPYAQDEAEEQHQQQPESEEAEPEADDQEREWLTVSLPEKSVPQALAENEAVVRMKMKQVLEELFDLKDDQGRPLFSQKNHWWVVYRLFIDKHVYHIRENKYKEFIDTIQSLAVGNQTVALDLTTLSNISQEDIYRLPFSKWKSPVGASSRKLTAYQRMHLLGDHLVRILTDNGFGKKA